MKNVALSCLVALAGLPFLGHSQIITRKVTFPPGKTTTTISSSISGRQTIDYALAAKAGQSLNISLITNNGANYFNLLPPGSSDVADYNSSIDGNTYSGTVSKTGVYKIRVYLMRSAGRRGEVSPFKLKVALSGGSTGGGASVSGPKFTATGPLTAIRRGGGVKETAQFGVIRMGGGTAEVYVTFNDGFKRNLRYNGSTGKWVCISGPATVTSTKIGDEWKVVVNGQDTYFIPEMIVFGG